MAGVVVKEFLIKFTLTGKQAQKALSSFQKDMKKIQQTATKANNIFGKLFGVATVAGFAKITNDSAKFAHSMTVLARETGIAGQKLRDMRSAFNAMAGTGETAIKTVERIQQGLARTFYGDSGMANQLRSMGIDAFKNGVMRDATDILGDISDWIVKKNQSGTDERVIRQYLKDRFGIDDSQFEAMKGGREAYLKKIAEETSAINDEQTKALDELNTSLNRLKESIENGLIKSLAKIAPPLTAIAEKIAGFVKENPEVAVGGAIVGTALTTSLANKLLGSLFGGKAATAGATAGGAGSAGGVGILSKFAGAFLAYELVDEVGTLYDMATNGVSNYINEKIKEGDTHWWSWGKNYAVGGGELGRRFADFVYNPNDEYRELMRKKYGVGTPDYFEAMYRFGVHPYTDKERKEVKHELEGLLASGTIDEAQAYSIASKYGLVNTILSHIKSGDLTLPNGMNDDLMKTWGGWRQSGVDVGEVNIYLGSDVDEAVLQQIPPAVENAFKFLLPQAQTGGQ